MLIEVPASPVQLVSALRPPPGIPMTFCRTFWVPFRSKKPSQYEQDILEDLGHHAESTTLLLRKVVVPCRKKQVLIFLCWSCNSNAFLDLQPDTLTRLLAAVHTHLPSRPTPPLLDP